MLGHADEGRPGLVLVEGPAGIGKTALVRRFLEVAGEPRTLWASGEEAERMLSLGVVGQLTSLASMGPSGSLVTTSRTDQGTVAPLAAGAALVDLLGELQQAGPVLLVVDDAHWADHASLQALTFALRRLRVDRVLALVLVRDVADTWMPDGLRRLLTSDQTLRLSLSGMPATELRDLSSLLCPRRLSLSAAERLRAHTHGNPLYARALLEQLPVTALEAAETPLPAPHSFAMMVLARLAACGQEVQELVSAASVVGTRCTLDQAAALAHTQDPLGALEQAIAAGLLVEEPGTAMVVFAHPLVHAAVYQQLGPARRTGLHTRAAAVSSDEVTRLRHRARAVNGLDSELGVELADLGRRMAARGHWAAAGEQLATAARLSLAGAGREQLVLEAAECQLLVGEGEPASLTDRVLGFPASGWRSYILARLAFVVGGMAEIEGLLQDAWQRCNPDTEGGLAARIAGMLATLYVLQGRGRHGAEWASRALRLAPGQIATDLLRFLELVGLGMSGQAEAALASLESLPAPSLATVAELDALLGRGILRLWTDDLAGAREDLSGALSVGHDRSIGFRGAGADFLANLEYRLGRWDDATVHSELALSIAEDAGQAWLAPMCHATAAVLAAARGQLEQAGAHAQTAQRTTAPGWFVPLAYTSTAAAQVARARGQPEAVIAALDPLRQLCHYDGVAEPGHAGWQDLLADALVAVGDHDQAEDVLGPFEALTSRRGRRSAMAAAARSRGTLEAARGHHDAAEAAFQAGLVHAAEVEMPFERARLRLAYGAFLRRAGKRTLAAEQLGAARLTLTQLGARPDLERCDRELAGCGLSSARPSSIPRPDLTAQELAVARLVATGLSNRQVARELLVSVKTVEYHLSHVYTKLQVTSRAHLGSRLHQD